MTPKEDQQPMTTREELVALADEFDDIEVDADGKCKWAEVANAQTHLRAQLERLASRQEVSVEELGLALRLVAPDELPPAYFKRGSDVRKAIARDMARALLAEYSITKRTTEG